MYSVSSASTKDNAAAFVRLASMKFENASLASFEYETGEIGIPISPVEHSSLIFRGSFSSYPGGTILYILSAKRAAFHSH